MIKYLLAIVVSFNLYAAGDYEAYLKKKMDTSRMEVLDSFDFESEEATLDYEAYNYFLGQYEAFEEALDAYKSKNYDLTNKKS